MLQTYKLYKETKSTLKVDTSEVSVSTYCCKLIQDIANNGDGGLKHAEVMSDEITIEVEEAGE